MCFECVTFGRFPHMHVHTYTGTNEHTHTHAHAHTARTQAHTRAHTPTHIHSYACTYSCAHTRTHACTLHAHTHTRTRARTRTHTSTPTHVLGCMRINNDNLFICSQTWSIVLVTFLQRIILGSMWAQSWTNIQDIVKPYPNKTSIDVTAAMREQVYSISSF